MNDMTMTVVPKSDQLNADDLIAGPRTITITRVQIGESAEQPVSVFFDGDNGKPWKPCKQMRRVMIHCWGPDAKVYAGRRVTIYRDPTVKYGGFEVGGIRISHMSDIDKDQVMALTVTKAQRRPFTVKPLRDAPRQDAQQQPQDAPKQDRATEAAAKMVAAVEAAGDAEDGMRFAAILADETFVKQRAWLMDKRPELSALVEKAITEANAKLPQATAAPDNDFPGDRP